MNLQQPIGEKAAMVVQDDEIYLLTRILLIFVEISQNPQ